MKTTFNAILLRINFLLPFIASTRCFSYNPRRGKVHPREGEMKFKTMAIITGIALLALAFICVLYTERKAEV